MLTVEKQLTQREFERRLLNVFRGHYVNPKKLNSFCPERLYKLFNEPQAEEKFSPSIEIKKSSLLVVDRVTIKGEKNTMANQTLGSMKPNSKFKEKGSYDMEINIPFLAPCKFWVQPYIAEDGKSNDKAPSMIVYHAGNRVGAMWSKVAKNHDGFFSASIFKLGEEGNSINFNLFPIKRKEGNGSEVETGEYSVSYWTPDARDEEEINHEPK